jgi:nucleoside-diphosphate kinase
MNYSIGLLKPDCLKRGIVKEVLKTIESIGLEIIIVKRLRLTKREIDTVWASCLTENFYKELLEFSLSGDCMIFLVKGDNAINLLNNLVGYHEPMLAGKGTIRHRFGKSVKENVIHSTATEKTFWKEVLLFFTQSELDRLLPDLKPKVIPQN